MINCNSILRNFHHVNFLLVVKFIKSHFFWFHNETWFTTTTLYKEVSIYILRAFKKKIVKKVFLRGETTCRISTLIDWIKISISTKRDS